MALTLNRKPLNLATERNIEGWQPQPSSLYYPLPIAHHLLPHHHLLPQLLTTYYITPNYLITYCLLLYSLLPTTSPLTTLLLYHLKALRYILQNTPCTQRPSSAKTPLKTGKWLQIWVWRVPFLVQF